MLPNLKPCDLTIVQHCKKFETGAICNAKKKKKKKNPTTSRIVIIRLFFGKYLIYDE